MIILNLTAEAQQWTPNFKHYGIRDGLPSSEVYQIASDAQKNLWFVTDRGVVRYDGYSFKVYDNKNSLPDNSVIKVYKDYKQRVWFISYTGVLSYYENEKIIPYKYNHVISSNLGITLLISIFVDKNETVLLNELGGRLHAIDSSGKYSGNIFPSDTATYTIADTGRVATFFTLSNNNKAVPVCFKIKSPGKNYNILINEKIHYQHFATTKLRNGDLIFYCGFHLIRIRPDGSYERKRFEKPVLNVFEDSQNNLWIGCYYDGVYVYNSSMSSSSHYLTDFSVSHIYTDYEGGVWLSTLENGIFYLPSGGQVLNEQISAIEHLSDSVLVFASKGSLYKFNSFNLTVDKINLTKTINPNIHSINSLYYLESQKQLVVAFHLIHPDLSFANRSIFFNWNGLGLVLTYSTTRFIAQDEHHLLGSTFQSVYLYNTGNRIHKHLNKNFFHPTTVFKDSRGRLLAGGLDGLYIYNDSIFIPFDSTNTILRKRITDIQELEHKYLVVATRSDGIILYSDTSEVIINRASGLSSDNINRIIVEPRTIWASTNHGLNKIIITGYNPLTYTIQLYNMSSGLPSDEINDFAIKKNNIYVATNDGLALIKQDMSGSSEQEMPLYINAVKINDQDTSILSSYSLNHEQNTLNITFSSVSFKHSKSISYLYRLEGLDTTWRSTLNRDVQFTNLPPGEYKFQLLGQNSAGVFPSRPLEINFNISPPFYQAIWFRLLAAFIFWVILLVFIRLRITSVKKKAEARHALNKKFSELNLNALRSQMNPHFTFNVLNSIQYYIAKKDSESAQLYITKFSRLIRMILDQSRTEFISLAEEIRILTLYIELEELRFEKKFSYSINVDAHLNSSGIYIPGMLIQPFIENSIKHGIRFKKGEAHVDIDFRTSDSILICTITDNGVGREEATKHKDAEGGYKSIGTAIVDERIQALGILFDGKLKNYISDLKDENGNAAGTRVTVEIPFKIMRV